MKKFSVSSLLVMTTSCAILFVYVRMPMVAALILCLLPLVIGAYGLTAPAGETSLDMSTRPGVLAATQVWGVSVVMVFALMIASFAWTDLGHAIDRARYRQSLKTPHLVDRPSVVYGLDD